MPTIRRTNPRRPVRATRLSRLRCLILSLSREFSKWAIDMGRHRLIPVLMMWAIAEGHHGLTRVLIMWFIAFCTSLPVYLQMVDNPQCSKWFSSITCFCIQLSLHAALYGYFLSLYRLYGSPLLRLRSWWLGARLLMNAAERNERYWSTSHFMVALSSALFFFLDLYVSGRPRLAFLLAVFRSSWYAFLLYWGTEPDTDHLD